MTRSALPAYTNAESLALSWQGDDGTGSGIAVYEVEHRLGEGAWSLWASGGAGYTSASYPLNEEGTYSLRVHGEDYAGYEASSATQSVVVDWYAPTVTLTVAGAAPYTYIEGNTIYYGSEPGTFTLTLTATETIAGLDEISFPDTVSAGDVYTQGGALTATIAHAYTFDGSDTASGSYVVTVTDRAGNEITVPFTITRDASGPAAAITATLDATTTIHVDWSATDPGSGVEHYDVAFKIDDGEWIGWFTDTVQITGTLAGERGHLYAFRVQATDRVSNAGAWTETSVKATITRKYYYVAGQRVAMRANGVVYWLHGDHLGSTSLTTDENGAVVAEQRYLPYGETRWVSGTLPTDFTYTGQRKEDFGLLDYHARYYSGRLGRFISPDTLVPDPANPQSLNRFSYVLANPLRYIDPTGYLSEDQIMSHFGVSTWEDVLAFFGEGRELEGRWGWLETLRQAELGDEISFYDDAPSTWPPSESAAHWGVLVDREGELFLQSGNDMIGANEAAWGGNVYYIARSFGRNPPAPYLGPIHANQMYKRLKFDTSQVDQFAATLDLVGIGTSFIPLPQAQAIGYGADVVSIYQSSYQLAVAGQTRAPLPEVFWAGFDFTLDMGGFIPAWGVIPDLISLGKNLAENGRIYYGP